MKELIIFKHVLGANLMIQFLLNKGFLVKLSNDAIEGRAPIMIEEEQYKKGLEALDTRLNEIRSRLHTYEK